MVREEEFAAQQVLDRASSASRIDQEPLNAALREVFRVVEGEWCDTAGYVDDHGQPLVNASGRGAGPVFKMLPVVPPMPRQGLARTDEVGLGLDLAINCWSEAAGILSRVQRTGVVTAAAGARWMALKTR